MSLWYHGALAVAASGETAAVSLSKPYGVNVFVLDRQRIVSTLTRGGGGKTGPRVGLVADGASFGIFYSRRDGSHYSPLEQAFTVTVDELEDVSLAPLWLHGAPFSARLQPDGSKVVITPVPRSQ